MTNTRLSPTDSPSVAEPTLRPVQLGVVGANFGAGIVRHLARQSRFVRVASVCDTDLPKARQLGAEVGVPAFGSLDQLLADDSVETVALFTPPAGRGALMRRVLESGRHVMTTKPFEIDCDVAEAVLLDAGKRGLAVHLNSPAPVPAQDIRQIKSWVAEHDLGAPIAMRAATWANYREVANGSWYDDPVRCPVAPIFRLGVYFLNDFAALLGEATRVHVMQSRIFTQRPTADNAQLNIEYRNGALANIFASFCIGDGKPWSDQVVLNYERGSITRWVRRIDVRDMGGDVAVLELQVPDGAVKRFETRPGGFEGWYDWEAFHDAVRGLNSSPLQNSAQVLFGLRLLDAMTRSAASGLPEPVH